LVFSFGLGAALCVALAHIKAFIEHLCVYP
jgi:hypothetical protein